MDSIIPASKISTLTQGTFVSAVADNFDQQIERKLFHAEIVVDADKVKQETQKYVPIPPVLDWSEEKMKQAVQNNYTRIKEEITHLVETECARLGIKA